MANTAKNTKAGAKATATATAKPRQASAAKTKAAEPAKPTKAKDNKGIELVTKVKEPKKTNEPVAATMRKSAPKNEKVVAISQSQDVSREAIAQVAYLKWVERGRQHGYALEDWIQAERELLARAS